MTSPGRHAAAAIVLAGGASARFGGDKLAAALDDASVLATTIAAVARVADPVVIAGPAPTSGVEEAHARVTGVVDATPGAGPLAALAGVLAATAIGDARLALVVGGDMPAVVPAVLALMLQRLADDPEAGAVLLEAPGAPRRQVLPMAVRVVTARRAAEAAVAAGERSLVRFLDRLRTVELPVAEWQLHDPAGATLADVDTPADLERLRRAAGRERHR